ncbi:ribosome-inactivating family protein [Streptomyces sp. NPDC047042]|uniref:ribosome-inactivating family protein n=1 Tax=Streptomyces sp. NPDC047042 TaxID=3154807 RepID=UPI003403BD3C
MSHTNLMTLPEREADKQPTAVRARKVTVGSVVTTIVLSIFTTLLGPLGVLQSASAADGNPTFRIGTDGTSAYRRFIDSIRGRVNDGGSTSVRNAQGYRVDHTPSSVDPKSTNAYIRVDVQAWGSDVYVRLNLRRSDLYLIGWWDKFNTYHYLGTRDTEATKTNKKGKPYEAESARWNGGEWRKSKVQEQTKFGENYVDVERITGRPRAGLGIGRGTINSAVWNLYNGHGDEQMAWGVLVMAQFVSEAVRLRPMRDQIATVMGSDGTFYIPREYAEMQNDWGSLSSHFNRLVQQDEVQGRVTRDPQPLVGYRQDIFGDPTRLILEAAYLYATYVLNAAKGR